MTESRNRIDKIENGERKLYIGWGDGHRSVFHYVWLRDNCSCPACGESSTLQQRIDGLLRIPSDITPSTVELDHVRRLKIHWSPDQHQTLFEPAWLRDHCYSKSERERRRHKPILWGKELDNRIPIADFDAAVRDDTSRLEAMLLLRDYGFVRIQDVPVTPDGLERVASMIGYAVRDTYYGRIFHIRVEEGSTLMSSTNATILPHNDEGWRAVPLGVVMFHCVDASADGGGQNKLIDGFRVCESLRAQDERAFDLLSRVTWTFFRSIPGEVESRSEGRIISIDQDGNVVGLRCPFRFRAPLDMPEDMIEPVYDACRKLMRLIYSGDFDVTFSLRPGEVSGFRQSSSAARTHRILRQTPHPVWLHRPR